MRDLDIDDKKERDDERRDKRQDDSREERDTRKDSIKVEKMSDKSILAKSKDILARDDNKASRQERQILERSLKIYDSKNERNRKEANEIFDRKCARRPKEGDEKRLNQLNKEYNMRNNAIERTKDILEPQRALQRENASMKETRKDIITRIENTMVYVSPVEPKIHIRSDIMDRSEDNPRLCAALALDIAKYRGATGRDICDDAKKEIRKMHIARTGESIVPKYELEKIATLDHPEAIRAFYEMGLRVGRENPKTEEINNACKLLNAIPKENTGGRIEVINRLLDNKIQNAKMDDKAIQRTAERIGREGRIKYARNEQRIDRIKNAEQKESLKSVLKTPEKAHERIVDLLSTSSEKLDFRNLRDISKEAEKLVQRDPIELKEDQLRDIMAGPNAYIVPKLDKLNIKLPDKVEIDVDKYKEGMRAINKNNEKNETIKLAVLSLAVSKEGERHIIGTREQKEHIQKMYEMNPKDEEIKSQQDMFKFMRTSLREIELQDRRDEKRREELSQGYGLIGIDAEKAAWGVSKIFGDLSREDNYSRQKAVEDIKGVKDEIKQYGHQIYYMQPWKIFLKDKDLISMSSKDPQLLIEMQRLNVPLHRNGMVNEERLQEKIDLMKAIPEGRDTERMAVLTTLFSTTNKYNDVSIAYPVDMGSRELTKSMKNLTVALVCEERGIPYREPNDAKEREAVHQGLEVVREARKALEEERNFIERTKESKFDAKEIADKVSSKEELYNEVSKLILSKDYEKDIKDLSDELASRGKLTDEAKILDKLSSSNISDTNFIMHDCIGKNENPTNKLIALMYLFDEKNPPYKLSDEKSQMLEKEISNLRAGTYETRSPQVVVDYLNKTPYDRPVTIDSIETIVRDGIDNVRSSEKYAAEAMYLGSIGVEGISSDMIGSVSNVAFAIDGNRAYVSDNDENKLAIEKTYQAITKGEYSEHLGDVAYMREQILAQKDVIQGVEKRFSDQGVHISKSDNFKYEEKHYFPTKYGAGGLKESVENKILDGVETRQTLSIIEDLKNAGVNCELKYADIGHKNVLSISNIDMSTMSNLSESAFNTLKDVIAKDDKELSDKMDSFRIPDLESSRYISEAMQRFEVMNDYIDHTYRNTEREKQAEDTYFNAKDDIESKYPDFEKALQRDVDAGRLNDNTKLEMIINYNTYITQMGNIFSDLERAYQWRESSAETDRYFDEHGEELIQEAYEREEKEKIAEETMLFKPIEYIYSAEDFLSNFTERFSYSIDTGELREYYKKVVNLEKYVKETALNYCTPEIDKEYVSASIDLRNNEICLTYGPDTIQEGEYLARYQIDSNTLTLDWNRHPDTCSYLGNNQLFHIAAQRLANIKEDSIASIASNYTYELSHMINLDLFNGSARQIEEDIKNQTGTYEEAKESAYFMSMNQEAIREIQTGRVNEALLYREDLNGCPAMAEEGLNNLIRSCIYIN